MVYNVSSFFTSVSSPSFLSKHSLYISFSGWIKGSVSLDPSEEHVGYFIHEDQVTSEPEEEQENKLVRACQFFSCVFEFP